MAARLNVFRKFLLLKLVTDARSRNFEGGVSFSLLTIVPAGQPISRKLGCAARRCHPEALTRLLANVSGHKPVSGLFRCRPLERSQWCQA